MEIGEVFAKFTKNSIEVYQCYGSITQPIRSYPRLLKNEICEVCKAPLKLRNCHRGFLYNDLSIPSKLFTIGYYCRNNPDQLTEDVRRVREAKKSHYSIYSKILTALALLLISSSKDKYTHLLLIPSRPNKKVLLNIIIEKLSYELNLQILNPKYLILHNIQLHEESHVRKTSTYTSRRYLINNIFKPIKDSLIDISGTKILLIDDLVQTGLSMNRIGSILLEKGADFIHGFSWTRAIEDKELYK